MSKKKDHRKQMKQQLKAYEAQIESFGVRAATVEATTLKCAQEQLVSLVDAMDAQLRVWQNNMATVSPQVNEGATNGSEPNEGDATLSLWNRMAEQIAQWVTTTAAIRMTVGADALWQWQALRALDTTASEQLRALKNAQNGEQALLQTTATEALAHLKQALERVTPV